MISVELRKALKALDDIDRALVELARVDWLGARHIKRKLNADLYQLLVKWGLDVPRSSAVVSLAPRNLPFAK
jgi:hypothetical protein